MQKIDKIIRKDLANFPIPLTNFTEALIKRIKSLAQSQYQKGREETIREVIELVQNLESVEGSALSGAKKVLELQIKKLLSSKLTK